MEIYASDIRLDGERNISGTSSLERALENLGLTAAKSMYDRNLYTLEDVLYVLIEEIRVLKQEKGLDEPGIRKGALPKSSINDGNPFVEEIEEKGNKQLSNLLAVIHRDGGHYEQEHGTEKAVNNAIARYYQLVYTIDMLLVAIDSLPPLTAIQGVLEEEYNKAREVIGKE